MLYTILKEVHINEEKGQKAKGRCELKLSFTNHEGTDSQIFMFLYSIQILIGTRIRNTLRDDFLSNLDVGQRKPPSRGD